MYYRLSMTLLKFQQIYTNIEEVTTQKSRTFVSLKRQIISSSNLPKRYIFILLLIC